MTMQHDSTCITMCQHKQGDTITAPFVMGYGFVMGCHNDPKTTSIQDRHFNCSTTSDQEYEFHLLQHSDCPLPWGFPLDDGASSPYLSLGLWCWPKFAAHVAPAGTPPEHGPEDGYTTGRLAGDRSPCSRHSSTCLCCEDVPQRSNSKPKDDFMFHPTY